MDNLRRFFTGFIVIFILLLFGIAAGCTAPADSVASTPRVTSGPVEKVEVYHFHGNQQCASCIAVGDLAEKTVNENFKDELASGRLVFAHINAQQPENADLAAKYGVTGSSLWIGVYDANGFYKEENVKVWYLINNPEEYSLYLTDLINKRLNGDLS
jgi:thiol-disulfide isomerase/thioredoxin